MCNSQVAQYMWAHTGTAVFPVVIREGTEGAKDRNTSIFVTTPIQRKASPSAVCHWNSMYQSLMSQQQKITSHCAVSIKLLKFSQFLFLDQSGINVTNIFMKGLACFPESSDASCSYQAVNAITRAQFIRRSENSSILGGRSLMIKS